MGADCSNCKCTNREDEKILLIDNADKISHQMKMDSRKDKLEMIEKSKSQSVGRSNLKDVLNQNPPLVAKIVKLQALIRKYRDRKIYKVILKKFRVRNFFNSYFI
jgi:hypothetical protein